MDMLKKNTFLAFAICWLFFIQCTSDNSPATSTPYLLSSTTTSEYKIADIAASAKIYGNYVNSDIAKNPDPYIKYEVKTVKVLYTSQNVEGKNVSASGLLVIPQNVPSTKSLYMVDILHQTETSRTFSISNAESSTYLVLGRLLASMGLVMVMPDYIGYGNTITELHPYEEVFCAKSCVDILYAAQEYAKANSININNKVVITGYSQGGSNAVATHKYIQENNITDFKVVKTIAGSGAYDKLGFTKEVIKQNKPLSFLPVYLWVLNTYQKMYNVLNYATIMNPDYYTAFAGINYDFSFALAGKVGTTLDATGYLPILDKTSLSTLNPDFINPTKLFTSTFIEQIANEDATIKPFLDVLKKNTMIDWSPNDSLKLVYGTLDSFVYPLNAINAEAAMKAKGSTKVKLIVIPNADHNTTASLGYYPIVLSDFASLASSD